MKGEVTLRVECLLPERLVERAIARGARFEALRRPDGRTLVAECDAASARILLSLCRHFNVPAAVTRRRGGSAFQRFARKRATLPVGLLLAATLCALFLGRIWFVDVALSGETADRGDPLALKAALEAMGVRPGIPRNIDSGLIAQTLQAEAGSYSYVGAHLQGVRLLVEAVPEIPAPQVYDVEAARDLVCQRDGIVVSAVARSGELCVKPGDAVRRGQVLIRGEELSGKEETRPIAALGEVIVRTWYEGTASMPLTAIEITDTGRSSTSSRLLALGREWSITPGETYASQRIQREYLPVGGLFLPVGLLRETRYETRERRREADPDAIRARLAPLAVADAMLALEREGPEEWEDQRLWIEYDNTGGALRARAVCEIQADAAVTREALQGG